MGRKNLLKPTQKKPSKEKATGGAEEARRKKAILDAVAGSSASVKGALEELGVSKSTYYKWLKAYKDRGLKGLESGKPVSGEIWRRLSPSETKEKKPTKDSKLPVEETKTMKSEQDKRMKELLFKKFDEEPAAPAEEAPKMPGEAPPAPSDTVPPEEPPEEPMDKMVKYAVIGFCAVIAILLMASLSNSNNFYFKQKEQMVELWQGRFAPMGERFVASFSDAKLFESFPKKDVYSKKEAYAILSDYFVKRADEILNTGEIPDVRAVKSYLTQASNYARSESAKKSIRMRLNSIEFLVLLGKADLALSKGTLSDFEAAKQHLTRAIPLTSSDLQKDVLMKRLAAVEYALATHKIEKGEKQLADLYRDALQGHLKKAKQYDPEKTEEIKQEMTKIEKWLDDFDKRYVGTAKGR